MSAATVHVLPGIGDGGQDHAADVAALVEELGALSVELADARAMLDQMRAAFGVRSDERDRWHGLALAYFGEGYRAGGEAGEVIGAERAITNWKVTAGALPLSAGGPSAVEQDRRRYPSYRPGVPSGRLSWVIVRAGERCAHESVGQECPTGFVGCPYAAEGASHE